MNGYGYHTGTRGSNTRHLQPSPGYAERYEDREPRGRHVFARSDDLSQTEDHSELGDFGRETLNRGLSLAQQNTEPFSYMRPFRQQPDYYDRIADQAASTTSQALSYDASRDRRRGNSLFGTALGLATSFIPGANTVASGVPHVFGG